MKPLLATVLAIAAPLIAACGDEPSAPPEPPSYPEGTVLAIGGVPITAADVDQYVDAIALIEPEFVERDHRRKVLSNVTFPVKAGAALDPAARDEAFREAQRLLAIARETGVVPKEEIVPTVLTGTFREVGLVPWAVAKDMEPLTFSDLHETPGAWTFFKLTASGAPQGEFDGLTQVTIVRYDVPYIEREVAREMLQSAVDGLPIEVVDPEWEPIVPPLFLYRSGSTPQR